MRGSWESGSPTVLPVAAVGCGVLRARAPVRGVLVAEDRRVGEQAQCDE
ncbi:MAG: hypothetical protein ACRDRP_10010 [Pseudonocardiaceae bacterium]